MLIANVVALIPIADTVIGQQRHADVETIGVADPGKPSLISLAKGCLNRQNKQVRYLPLAAALRAGCIERCSPSSKEARWSNPCRLSVLTSYVSRAKVMRVIPKFDPIPKVSDKALAVGSGFGTIASQIEPAASAQRLTN